MVLLGALLALLAGGLWMYALVDVLITPRTACYGPGKAFWVVIVVLLLVPGALAWLFIGRPYAVGNRVLPPRRRWGRRGLDAEAALLRHPAGRTRQPDWAEPFSEIFADELQQPWSDPWPTGPDDDPDFLRYLDRVVQDIREAGNGA